MTLPFNTVGIIQARRYPGWYILVKPQPGEPSFYVYTCTDTTFVFNPAIRECYDDWLPNYESLEGLFEDNYPHVEWQTELQIPDPGGPAE